MAVLTAISFLLGAVCSGVAGYVGLWVSVRANVRCAPTNGCKTSFSVAREDFGTWESLCAMVRR